MRINSKLPKTFSILAKKGNKEGYIRFHGVYEGNNIKYMMHIVKDINDSSRFVNFDNVKRQALIYKEKYNLEDVRIIDDCTKKVYYVKKPKN